MIYFISVCSLLRREPTSAEEVDRVARAYLLYLFGAVLFPNRRYRVHLAYLPALRDLATVGQYDWGGATLACLYTSMGAFSRRTGISVGGHRRLWTVSCLSSDFFVCCPNCANLLFVSFLQLWTYEVLRLWTPRNTFPDREILPRALAWRGKVGVAFHQRES